MLITRCYSAALLSAALFSALLLAGCGKVAPPDAIVTGTLYTMDPAQPRVEAVAIDNGRFSYVGDRAAAMALKGPETRVINLGEGVAYPGLIDAHLHVAGIGAAMRAVNLSGADSFTDIIERIAARAGNLRDGVTVTGHGWHQSKWREAPPGSVDGFPTHHALSEAVPSNPVILEHANGHSVLLNQAAMDQLGIDARTLAPDGGVIVMQDGEPTGLLHETAIALAAPLQAYDRQTAEELLELAQRHLLSEGITTAHDAGALQVDLAAQTSMATRGDLVIRLYSMVLASDQAALDEWLARGPLLGEGDNRLTVRSIKVQADGALGSRTAWLHAPYSDAPDTTGVLTYDLDALRELIRASRRDQWQINVHAIGDRANSEVLEIFAPFTSTAEDHRFRIEHAQHLRPGDGPLFASQGVIASMQPIHLSSDRPWAIDRLDNSGLMRALIFGEICSTREWWWPQAPMRPLSR